MNIIVAMPDDETRASFITDQEWAYIDSLGDPWRNPHRRWPTGEEWADILPQAEAVITGWGAPCFDAALLDHAPKLKIIAHTGGSVATLVDRLIYDRGIKLVSANEVYAQSVAEGVIGYILAAQRDIPYWDRRMHEGGWSDSRHRANRSLLDQRVGLVGFGAIPRYLTPMLKAFSCEVLAYDPYVGDGVMTALGARKASMEEVMGCDIVSLHAPRTPETDGLIGAEELALMPYDGLLINTARGNILDEAALCAALEAGRIRCALDVYEPEPPATDHAIRTMSNALLMPHMAGPTVDRRPLATRCVLDEIRRALAGEPLLHEIPYAYAVGMTR